MQKIPLILTRPKGSNAVFEADIAPKVRQHVDFIHSPLLEIVPIDGGYDSTGADHAIFTSANGVKYAPKGNGRRAFCVGEKTTQLARSHGWDAVFAGATVLALKDHVLINRPQGEIHHYSGVFVRGNVAEDLSVAGLRVTNIPLYEQRLLPFSAQALSVLERRAPVVVPLFSPRTAAHFAAIAPAHPQLYVVAMSTAVADSCNEMSPARLIIAREPTAKSMALCVENLVLNHSLG
ncbi:uroporphyrinogen-III synthase [Roseobacter denitrificans]|uniref:Uroporphyrinogen-III synthase, putative n=1 Tax=Roseobacter denitrificans (strain ATCC 33942 / OCh 114) TaxID=375451 RepID=Q16CW2_ROSDO|nr:uroporphyrinogen-III synthase [Roseobacter denitrificans]ABG30181.1 uroporphyrinogen-III synthase, putative [Roseobacter denitrificans OCh 114]SFF70359.1 uroporphyrinogen-III synthase [Roseobacter denitrificans OCh 114]